MKSPAVASRTSESATCATTSAWPTMRRWRVGVAAPASRSVAMGDPVNANHAGASPNSRPARTESAAVNSSTRPSGPSSRSRRGAGPTMRIVMMIRASIPAPKWARPMPSSPPIADSSSDSLSIWRTRRKRPAPRDTRMAISRWRTEARASSRLAMFAHAISRSVPTAAMSARRGRENRSWSGVARPAPAGVTESVTRSQFGSFLDRARSSILALSSSRICACARSMGTPGLRCPTRWNSEVAAAGNA